MDEKEPSSSPAMIDINELSMEQGKEYLRRCGIPQRDIDLMTEKWVVMASVEVLIRFPLQPGEDPTARCVCNKNYQPKVDPPNLIPKNHGDQVKRKCDNQLMKKFNKKPVVMKEMASHCIQPPPCHKQINSQKKKCIGVVNTRAPLEGEEENKVKCKNCGSFGHIARSRMCPMKRWNGALPVQPLGSNKERNLKTGKDQELQSPGMFEMTERKNKETQMQKAVPRKSLPQEFSISVPEKRMDSSEGAIESCFFVRKSTRPSIISMTKKKSSLSPDSKVSPAVKTPDMRAIPSCSYSKKTELNTVESMETHYMGFSDTPKPNLNNCQDSSPSSKKISPGSIISPTCAAQPDAKTLHLTHGISTQHFDLDLNSSVACVKEKSTQDSKVRIQDSGNKPVNFISQESQSHTKKPQITSCQDSTMETQVPEWKAFQASQSSLTTNECNVQEAPKLNPKEPLLKVSVHKEPLPSSSHPRPLMGKTVSKSTHSEIYKTPLSLGIDKDQSGFGISSVAMNKYPEKAKFVTQSNLNLKDSKILGSNTTRSVLYEDLLVSPSSEDSDE